MITITVKQDIDMPKVEFNSIDELRDLLNAMSIKLKEISDKKISKTTFSKMSDTQNTPLNKFNYLTDESL